MFDTLLIANRGEIACRVAATARRLGIRTVAVYSDADAGARHVRSADLAFRIGPAAAAQSYLRGDAIIEVALRAGAQAIHPGYGFLSENEEFARSCSQAGLIFVGPPPSAIRAMGLKAESKRLMHQAGVPLVPGYHGVDQNPLLLAREAERIGFPVLIKASAGGGGKGMRVVRQAGEFEALLASCKREAAASFGNDAVLIEKYLARPRHIEIQVFADQRGQVVHLFERDCSVQRRHQKVLEEAPAPGMTEARRRAMGEAAIAAARAVGYVGAGTVEFIAEAAPGSDPGFYFMEMNTRLQVEHPVTEMITGLDLVEWQLRVAAGEPLPLSQSELAIRGHALEARIYAENPETGFLPSIGRLVHLRTPAAVHFEVGSDRLAGEPVPAAVRIDSGVGEGDAITPHYDPMIAKLIVWGPDRNEALARMGRALAGYEAVGPATNVDFLARLVRSQAFASADLDTGLIERERATLLPDPAHPVDPAMWPSPTIETLALACGALLALESGSAGASPAGPQGRLDDPWDAPSGFRLNRPLTRTLRLSYRGQTHEVALEVAPGGYLVRSGTDQVCMTRPEVSEQGYTCVVGTRRETLRGVIDRDVLHLFGRDGHWVFGFEPVLPVQAEDSETGGGLSAPMPGKVIASLVVAGEKVSRGQALLVMEAMKMEHTLSAPADGTIDRLPYAVGDQVPEGALLVGFTPSSAPAGSGQSGPT